MREDPPQDRPLLAIDAGGGGGDDDALGVDHLPHHATGAVGGADQEWIEAELPGGDALEAAEHRIARGVGSGQGDAEPAEERREQRVGGAGARHRQPQDHVGPGIAGDEGQRQHRGDRHQGDGEPGEILPPDPPGPPRSDSQPGNRDQRRQEDPSACG